MFRNKLLAQVGIFTFLISASAAQALTIEISPPAQTVSVGSIFSVDVGISGLGFSSAPSLSTFDLDISFDPTIIGFNSISFGDPVLGDQLDLFGFGSLTSFDNSLPGIVNMFELSFDLPSELDAFQADSFTLATLTFDALSAGTSFLGIPFMILGDSFGSPLAASSIAGTATVSPTATVPEPGTIVLLVLGLFGMAASRLILTDSGSMS
jgi:hypothetical protein